jgi:hypothetical protein
MTVAGLPWLLSRPNVFRSLWGAGARVDALLSEVGTGETGTILLGHGLGAGANATFSLAESGWGSDEVSAPKPSFARADSTPTALVRQIGILGATLFYLLLASAWKRDTEARPFYLVVALVSLTISILELFPVNFLLGLAFARSIAGCESTLNAEEAE